MAKATKTEALTPTQRAAFRRGKGTITTSTAARLLGTDEDEVEALLKIVRAERMKPKPNRQSRLPVRDEVKTVDYHRPPTPGEIKFGHGATHYRTFKVEEVCHPGTRIKKSWFVADDGHRYYR